MDYASKSAPQPVRSSEPNPIPGRGSRFYPQPSITKIQNVMKHVAFFGWQVVNTTSKSDLEFRYYLDVKSGVFTSDTGSEVTIITEPASRNLKIKIISTFCTSSRSR